MIDANQADLETRITALEEQMKTLQYEFECMKHPYEEHGDTPQSVGGVVSGVEAPEPPIRPDYP